ncbi:MAG: hypothetical protein IKN39_03515, partial [Clostridia bacterium]|nr:hypothetical protein [Clostridia bacterium]
MNIIICTGALFYNRINWFDEIGKYANVTVFYYELTDSQADSRNLNTPSKNIRKKYIKSLPIPKLGNISF